MRARWAAVAVLLLPLYLVGTGGHALHNGDEAIYAEMAREMVATRAPGELQWQGEVQFPRPPGAVWVLAAARALADDERAVRWPLAAACALEVALVALLGGALFSSEAGAVAAGLLTTAGLFVGYARYFESEPILCCAVVGACLCWALARRRPRWVLGWGACLGAALMVKQLVGALPLLCVVVDRLAVDGDDGRRVRGWWRGLALAAALWLPWHAWALWRFGRPFVESYVMANIVARSSSAMLHATRWSFYARELWRSEGVVGLVGVGGVALALVEGVRRRRFGALLVAAWALGVFVALSAARSRYDHYLLLAYPAWALAAGALVARIPVGARLRALAGAALVITAAARNLPPNLRGLPGDDDIRALVAPLALAPPAQLYCFDTHPYSAKLYTRLPVATLATRDEDVRLAAELRRAGLPSVVLAARALPSLPRPFALLVPKVWVDRVAGERLRPVAEAGRFVLFQAD